MIIKYKITDNFGIYACQCNMFYEKPYCLKNAQTCQRFKPCYPSVKCTDLADGYKCGSCPQGMNGTNGIKCFGMQLTYHC